MVVEGLKSEVGDDGRGEALGGDGEVVELEESRLDRGGCDEYGRVVGECGGVREESISRFVIAAKLSHLQHCVIINLCCSEPKR